MHEAKRIGTARLPGQCLHKKFTLVFLPLQHILFCIIDSECKSRDVLQSYFDLLGELMKFNIDAFRRFNKYVNTEEKVSEMCSLLYSRLIITR